MSFEIAADFKTISCSEYCLRIADGTHDSPKEAQQGWRLATSKNVKNGRLVLDSAYLISEDDYNQINRRSKVDQWDLLLTMIGTVGEVCVVEQTEPDFAIKNVGLLKCGSELRAKWLYYFLISPQGQELINQRKKGSTQQYISLTEIRGLPISYPIDEKSLLGIVSILSILDDRITLLRETNATLEAIAQTLFKSWFVDFDPVRAKMEGRVPEGMDEATAALFPDSFEEAELGEVPRGWTRRTMADVATVGIGKTPPRKEQHWFSEAPSDIRWVSIRDMGAETVYASQTSEFLTAEAVERFNVRQVPDNTVLMSFKMTIGRVAITDGALTTNEAIAHFKLAPNALVTSEYIYMHLKQFDFSTLSSTSSIADAVNSKTVREIPITVPSPEVAEAFQSQVNALFSAIKNAERQAQTLVSLRDSLLPRLISGELSLVRNATGVKA